MRENIDAISNGRRQRYRAAAKDIRSTPARASRCAANDLAAGQAWSPAGTTSARASTRNGSSGKSTARDVTGVNPASEEPILPKKMPNLR